MNRNCNSFCIGSQEIITALRDIVDVLYDGNCEVLRDEELCSTIHKKMRELQFCSRRERKFKLLKIFNILCASHEKLNYNCKLNKEIVISILDEIYFQGIEILKHLDERV